MASSVTGTPGWFCRKRLMATSTYSGAISTLRHTRPVRCAAIGAKHSKIKLRARPRDTNFAPGTVLLREWGDREHKVAVTAEGLFEYEGSTFKSLTAVARQITGTHWSGPLFFGLTGKAGAQ